MATTFCEKLIEAADARPNKIAMKLLGEQVETTTFGAMLKRLRSIAFRLPQAGIAITVRDSRLWKAKRNAAQTL